MHLGSDYGDEWSGSRSGSPLRSMPSHLPHQQASSKIPLPTLYSAEGRRKLKPTITELVMYNMASMLAAVATGYDVRMSNVTPVHPKLQPQQMLNDNEISPSLPLNRNDFVTEDRSAYDHNTYHGPAKHIRYDSIMEGAII